MSFRARVPGMVALVTVTFLLVIAAAADVIAPGIMPLQPAAGRPALSSRPETPAAPAAVRSLRDQIDALSQRLRVLAPGGKDAVALNRQIAALKQRIERQFASTVAPASPAPPEVNAWPGNGLAICTAAYSQIQPVVTTDGSGGGLFAWTDGRAGSYSTIYATRATAAGAIGAGWAANGNPVSTSTRPQFEPSMASDGTGGAWVAWSETHPAGDRDIWIQRMSGSGAPAAGWPAAGVLLCVLGNDQKFPVVVSDGSGGAIVFWYDRRGGTNWDLYAQRVNASGVIQWALDGVPVSTASWSGTSPIQAPRAIADGIGGALIAWTNGWYSGSDNVYLQRITSAGAVSPGWPAAGVVACGAAGDQILPDLCSDGVAGAIVAWGDYRSDTAADVYAVRITGAGAVAPGWTANGTIVRATPGVAENGVQIVSNNSGGAIVLWQDNRNAGTTGYDLWARQFDPAGSPLWAGHPNGAPLCLASGLQAPPSAVTDMSGGVLACWDDFRSVDINIYAQHLMVTGQRAFAADGVPRSTAIGNQIGPQLGHRAIASTGVGNAVLVWEDTRNAVTSMVDIYAADLTGLLNLNATVTRPGWSSPLVPRNDMSATPNNAVVSATLDGNSATTWLSLSSSQAGPYNAPDYIDEFRIDGEFWGYWNFSDPVEPLSYFGNNAGPLAIRGGRHSLSSAVDEDNSVPESNELDNSWSGQWVWSPLVTTRAVPLVRPAPPDRGILALPNCDGFQFTRPAGYAWVVGLVTGQPGDDYDLSLYSDYSGSTAGFSSYLIASGWGLNDTDFVVGHFAGTPLTVYPAAVRYEVAGGGNVFVLDQTDAVGRNALASGVFSDQVLSSPRLVDVYEAYLEVGNSYVFSLVRNNGSADLAFSIFPGTPGGIHARGDEAAASVPGGPGYDSAVYSPSVSNWHPVVVYRSNGSNMGAVTYSLYWSPGVADAGPPIAPPTPLALAGVTPNPVSGPGVLRYSLSRTSPVRLSLFDIRGREIDRLLDGTMEAGAHEIAWSPRDGAGRRLASGVYWLVLEAEGKKLTSRVVVAR